MNEEEWAKYLSEINLGHKDGHPELQGERGNALLAALRKRFGAVSMGIDVQDQSNYAHYELPAEAHQDPANPYAGVRLSQFEGVVFEGLVTAFFEWDFTNDALERIKSAAAECECAYVPFTVFADCETFKWEDQYNLDIKGVIPPAGSLRMKRQELWQSLFDYL